MPRQPFERQTIIVTGGSMGIGLATALEIARLGGNLCLIARRTEPLARAQQRVQAAASSPDQFVESLACDVTDETQVDAFVQMGLTEFGHIDVLVNNAAWRARGDLLSIDEDLWQAALGVNLHAPFLTSKAVLPNMVRNNWGRIINYSGIAPFRGASGQGTLKMAAEGLTRAIAQEYGRYNITANCIGPGSIAVARTPGQETGPDEGHGPLNIPVPRQGTVEECSAAVVFLASEQASYITGQNYLVNGGAYFH